MIFQKNDPVAALAKTREKLFSVEENILSLRAKRAEVLLNAEDASAVTTIDRAIDAEEANARIYEDRIKALEEACRRDKYAAKEAERKKAIAAIGRKLGERVQVAEAYEASLKRTAELYRELMASELVDGLWPFGGMPSTILNTPSMRQELSWNIFGLLPEGHTRGLGVIGIVPIGVAAAVRAHNEAILAKLSYADIQHDLGDDAA
jgi:hypothetical protein